MTNEEASITTSAPIPNIAEMVTKLLADNGHSRPDDWLYFLEAAYQETDDVTMQLFYINRAWRDILSTSTDNTINIRFYLLDNTSIDEWAKLFHDGVLTFVLDNQLPHAPKEA